MTTIKQFATANVKAAQAQVNLLDATRGFIETTMGQMPAGTPKGKLAGLVKEQIMSNLDKAVKEAVKLDKAFGKPEFNCTKYIDSWGSINHSLGWFIKPDGELGMSRQLRNNLNIAIRNAKADGLESWLAKPDFKNRPAASSSKKAKKAKGPKLSKGASTAMDTIVEQFVSVVLEKKLTVAETQAMAKEMTEVMAKYAKAS